MTAKKDYSNAVAEAKEWLETHKSTHSARKKDVKNLLAWIERLQEISDQYYVNLLNGVIDVFEDADEDALADEIRDDVFIALGMGDYLKVAAEKRAE